VHTVIIGLGITGRSCLRYLAACRGPTDRLTALDTRPAPADADALARDYPDVAFAYAVSDWHFAGVDCVVVSPGIALEHCLVRQAEAAGAKISSDIDLFCEAARAPIYAVTGTNGKSTVTALTGHLLEALGRSPGVGGNLGEPALDLLAEDRGCYVLELSSFQLERMAGHPLRAAAILNVTEDHLDRHGSMAAYAAAKQRIYRQASRCVANRQDPSTLPQDSVENLVTFGADAPEPGHWGLRLETGEPWMACGRSLVMPLSDLPLTGSHNALNVLAALALVADADVPLQRLADAVKTFRGLPHRCQMVTEVRGVRFIDDSKATNVGATLAALDGLATTGARRLVLIAGGDGKGADFSPLRGPVGEHAKAVVLLGRDAPRLAEALEGQAPLLVVADMESAVAQAMQAAEPGDVVLLSPACASLDMFSNFAERGRVFARAVEALR
jgi:UDP-N-acetylmuramoylalanine--D-glutamate ligase